MGYSLRDFFTVNRTRMLKEYTYNICDSAMIIHA